MPFLRVLAESKMQTTSSKIWTWVTNSISYKNKYYTQSASSNIFFYCLLKYMNKKK